MHERGASPAKAGRRAGREGAGRTKETRRFEMDGFELCPDRLSFSVAAHGVCRPFVEAASRAVPNSALAGFDVCELLDELASRADWVTMTRHRDDVGDVLSFGIDLK